MLLHLVLEHVARVEESSELSSKLASDCGRISAKSELEPTSSHLGMTGGLL